MWPEECKDNAKRAINGALKRTKKNGELSLVLTDEYTREMALEDAVRKKVSGGYENWYPEYWFCFLTMGRPIGEGHCSPLFNSGIPTKDMPSGLGPTAAMEEGSRQVRRQQRKKVMDAIAVGERPQDVLVTKKARSTPSSSSDGGPIAQGNARMQEIAYQR